MESERGYRVICETKKAFANHDACFSFAVTVDLRKVGAAKETNFPAFGPKCPV